MAILFPFLDGRKSTPQTPYLAFVQARRDMNEAFAEWLKTRPDAEDVTEEVDGTVATLTIVRMVVTP